jgi:hypothetical protein
MKTRDDIHSLDDHSGHYEPLDLSSFLADCTEFFLAIVLLHGKIFDQSVASAHWQGRIRNSSGNLGQTQVAIDNRHVD